MSPPSYLLVLPEEFTGVEAVQFIGWWELQAALHREARREVPEEDSWRPVYLQKLLGNRVEAHYGADLEEEARLDGLIQSLVTN